MICQFSRLFCYLFPQFLHLFRCIKNTYAASIERPNLTCKRREDVRDSFFAVAHLETVIKLSSELLLVC